MTRTRRSGQRGPAKVDLVLLNDINGPIAFRHFENMGGGKVAAPEKVALVCDHFVPAPTHLQRGCWATCGASQSRRA